MRAVSTIKRRIDVSADSRYLTIGQVRERFGVSDMWVWRHMHDHGFPTPVQFGGPTSARHWLLIDIEQWERDRARQNSASRSSRVSDIESCQREQTKKSSQRRPTSIQPNSDKQQKEMQS